MLLQHSERYNWQKGALILWFAVLACTLGFNLQRDLIFSPDAATYLACAARFIELDHSVAAYLAQAACIPAPLTTLTPVMLLAGMQLLLPTSWPVALHIAQIFFALLGLAAALALVRRLSREPTTFHKGAFALGGLALCFTDMMLWPSYLLTDTLYTVALVCVLERLSHLKLTWGSLTNWGRLNHSAILVTLCTVVLTTRSAGMAALSGIVLGVLLVCSGLGKRSPLMLVSLSVVALLVVASGFGAFIEAMRGLNGASPLIDQVVARASAGMVATGREAGWFSPPTDALDFALLYLARWIHFFNPIALNYSLLHNAANTAILGSFALALVLWAAKLAVLSQRQHQAVVTGLTMICTVAGFHAATILDYDWRYRFPVLLPMMVFTSLIVSHVSLRPRWFVAVSDAIARYSSCWRN